MVERVDPECGSQDDLVEVAVREAVFVHLTKLGVRLEGLGQVLQDKASDITVGVDQQGPALVVGLLDQEVSQGDRQPSPWFAVCFQVGVEEGQLCLVSGPVHQDELGGRVVSQVLVHFPKGEVPAAKQHGEPVLLGPAIDGPCPGTDHPLGIGEDDESLALQGIQFVDDPLFDHEVLDVSKQDCEACRLIVLVIRERLRNAEPTHHLERDMIDDAGLPRLATLVGDPGRLPIILRGNDQLLAQIKRLSQGTDITPKGTTSRRVTVFQKNERGC